MQITGKTRVFKNEFGGNVFYSTSIPRKLEDRNIWKYEIECTI
jgi:hypothetical protein